MAYSMTGYGEQNAVIEGTPVSVTIQTLNHRGLDIYIELPTPLHKHMLDVRKLLAKKLQRGKVDMTLKVYTTNKTSSPFAHAQETIPKWYTDLDKVVKKLQIKTDILPLIVPYWLHHQPHLLLSDISKKAWYPLVEAAAEACVASRLQEGTYLADQLSNLLLILQKHIKKIEQRIPIRLQELKKSLEEKIKMREGAVDNPRWEQEILYYLDKIDIEEEVTRFKSHMTYLERTLLGETLIGKKISFILQEMLREINTLGAKAQDVFLQQSVVEVKCLLETMKEQARNLA